MPRHWSSISECSLVQPKAEGPRRPTKRKRSLQSTGVGQSIRQYSPYGKWPAVTNFTGKTQADWFKFTRSVHSAACMMDLAWALVRMTPIKLLGVEFFPTEKQKVPGWSGYNIVVYLYVRTHICYCSLHCHAECAVHDGTPWPK